MAEHRPRGDRADAKLVIAIELKINAAEHGNQLKRYRRIVAEEWPAAARWRQLFLFLTEAGEAASETDGGGWIAVSLDDAAKALAAFAGMGAGSPEARAMLGAYLAMLRRHHWATIDSSGSRRSYGRNMGRLSRS